VNRCSRTTMVGVAFFVICFLVGCLIAALLLPGCMGSAATTSTSTSSAAQTTVTASRPVHFTTDDGVALGGHLFGSGHAGVILCHMYPADQSSWYDTARRLAAQGYFVLTFDFRGYGDSGGQKDIPKIDRDVMAAIMEIRTEGAAAVVLIGASMGGTASLIAGDRAQALSSIRMSGVATLSAPVEFNSLSAAVAVPRIFVPLLFIAAENDAGAAGARELEQLSSEKGALQVVPGSDHGTNLLTGTQGGKVYQLLVDFLETCFR
jgi:pimeloyl-ACP methyl ester carboxylesterase